MLTERDVDWLRFMGRFPLLTAQHLMVYAGKSKAIVSRRLIEMTNAGYVEVALVTINGGRRLYSLSNEGRKQIGLPGKASGIRIGSAEHDSLVAWWFMQESQKFPDSEFLTDREIRSHERSVERNGLAPRYAVPRGGVNKGLMFPDFIRVQGDKFLAYELEYSPKYLKRTIENMQVYAGAADVAGVLYAAPGRLLPVVTEAAKKVNGDRQLVGLPPKIWVKQIWEGGDYGFVAEAVN